ncbi:MAG: immunoglobulin domain-containing protein [Phycisphaerales bacterium]|nr:immunoglobulin domain-containing protein [Phycisphaerales bacterium]
MSLLSTTNLGSPPHDVAISPDSRFAVVCAGDSADAITFYSMATGAQIIAFTSPQSAGPMPGAADSVAISPDSATTVVAHGRNIRFFNTSGPTPVPNGTFMLATDPHDLAITPNGNYAVVRTATADGLNGHVVFFTMSPPAPVLTTPTPTCPATNSYYTSDSIAVSPNSARVVAIGGAGNHGALVFDTSGAPQLLGIRFLHTPAHDVEITPSSAFALVRCAASPDGVALIPIAAGTGTAIGATSAIAPLSANSDYLAISPTENSAVILGRAGATDTVVTLNMLSPTQPPLVPLASVSLPQDPFDVAISPDGRLAVVQTIEPFVGGPSGAHVFFSMATGLPSATFPIVVTSGSIRFAADTVLFSPNSQYAVALGTPSAASGSLRIYDTSSMAPTLLVPQIAINTVPHDVEIAPNNSFVAVRAEANSTQATTFHSLTTGASIGMFGATGSPTIETSDSIVISPNSMGAVSIGSNFNQVQVFAVAPSCTPPSVTMNPASQTACAGQPVSFTVSASGSPAPTYQWRRNGSPIAGATGPMLTLQSASPSDAGSYDAVATNPCGSSTSSAASLVIQTSPSFSQNPTGLERCVGQSATFMVSSSGDPVPTLQWHRDGAPIPGATSSTFTLTPVVPTDAGTYDCVASNTCGSSTSQGAVLTVVAEPPTVSQHPMNQQVCIGQAVSMSVVASGQGVVAYQWRHDGTPIAGATTATLMIASPSANDSGIYDCMVSNECGFTASNTAVLTVMNSSPSIATPPSSQSACIGNPVALTLTAAGTPPLSYQWRHESVPINGATNNNFVIPAAAPADAGSYDCVVTNDCGSVTSSPATLTVLAPPSITTNPASQAVGAGGVAMFAVAADGAAPLTYRWRRGGIDLSNDGRMSGADTAVLTISPVIPTDAGVYDAVVTNVCGEAISSSAGLTVEQECAAWALASNVGPSPRRAFGMAYDIARDRVVLYGGFDATTTSLSDTWEWDGISWALRSTTGLQRAHITLAYDVLRQRTVFFGGEDVGDNQGHPETWTWDGNQWTPGANGSHRHSHAMVFDPLRSETVVFGGNHNGAALGDTWVWDGSQWTPRSPGTSPHVRDGHAMAYDSDRGVIVLFGGREGATRLGDTWEWNGTDWTQRSPINSPSPRNGHAMAYDAVRHRVVLFGGYDGQNLGDTWEFDSAANTWTHRMLAAAPVGRYGHSLVFDSARNRLVLFGGTPNEGTTVLNDTWILRDCSGDLNCDGALDNFDIDPFVFALIDPAGYATAYPNCDRDRADINGDGVVDNFDIDPFVARLIGQ